MLITNAIHAKLLICPTEKHIEISGLTFTQVSKRYPEAYDVFDNNGTQVGHVRLRWGCLSCHCPNAKGERIYESFFERDCMGEFDTDESRQIFLADVANVLVQKTTNSNLSEVQQFECIKWFTKCGFTFAEKGDKCNLIGKMKDGAWIIKAENGAVQIVEANKFREYFGIRIEVDESVVIICA
jgi:hypothetical protein